VANAVSAMGIVGFTTDDTPVKHGRAEKHSFILVIDAAKFQLLSSETGAYFLLEDDLSWGSSVPVIVARSLL